MPTDVAGDLFAPIAGDVDSDVVAGLAALMHAPPLWDTGAARWFDIVSAVRTFAQRHGGQARDCGWPALCLYGLHPRAPWVNLAACGAAWLVARAGYQVLAVGRDDILVVARSASRLRIYRAAPDPDAVLAWEIGRPK
jgi:hypothetical protein